MFVAIDSPFSGSFVTDDNYKNVVFISASSDAEEAYDLTDPLAQKTIDGKSHGAFTNALLKVLQGAEDADTNGDSKISYGELLDGVTSILVQGKQRQTPQMFPQKLQSSIFSDITSEKTKSTGFVRISGQIRSRVGIFYSTSTGESGTDGKDSHSPFAQSLINHITKPLTWPQLVDTVSNETYEATKESQKPYSEGDVPYDFAPSDVKNADKFALIIGNNDYSGHSLKNPVNDAKEIEEKLKVIGFNTTLLINGTKRNTLSTLSSFRDKLTTGSIGVVYYAGHGAQVDAKNYLIPVDFDIDRMHKKSDLEFDCIDLNKQIRDMSESNTAHTLLFIFDASRDNPLPRASR